MIATSPISSPDPGTLHLVPAQEQSTRPRTLSLEPDDNLSHAQHYLSTDIIENLRLVDPRTREAKKFQAEMNRVAKRLLPKKFKLARKNIRFLISDLDQHNAIACTSTKQPTIIFTRGLLDILNNEDQLAYVLGHELSHMVIDEELGPGENNKGEEFLCDIRPLNWVLDAAYNPEEAEKVQEKLKDPRPDIFKLYEYLDVHPLPYNRVKYVKDALAGLNQERGGIPKELELFRAKLGDEVVKQSATGFPYIKEQAQTAKHRSYYSRLCQKINYPELNNQKKLEFIKEEIRNLDNRFKARIDELRELLLNIELDSSDPAQIQEINAIADVLVDHDSSEIFYKLYSALSKLYTGEIKVKNPVLGSRLNKLNNCITQFIDADAQSVLDSATKLNQEIASIKDSGKLRIIDLDSFDVGTEADYGLDKGKLQAGQFDEPIELALPWYNHLLWSGEPSIVNNDEIVLALLNLGVRDHALLEYLSNKNLNEAKVEKRLENSITEARNSKWLEDYEIDWFSGEIIAYPCSNKETDRNYIEGIQEERINSILKKSEVIITKLDNFDADDFVNQFYKPGGYLSQIKDLISPPSGLANFERNTPLREIETNFNIQIKDLSNNLNFLLRKDKDKYKAFVRELLLEKLPSMIKDCEVNIGVIYNFNLNPLLDLLLLDPYKITNVKEKLTTIANRLGTISDDAEHQIRSVKTVEDEETVEDLLAAGKPITTIEADSNIKFYRLSTIREVFGYKEPESLRSFLSLIDKFETICEKTIKDFDDDKDSELFALDTLLAELRSYWEQGIKESEFLELISKQPQLIKTFFSSLRSSESEYIDETSKLLSKLEYPHLALEDLVSTYTICNMQLINRINLTEKTYNSLTGALINKLTVLGADEQIKHCETLLYDSQFLRDASLRKTLIDVWAKAIKNKYGEDYGEKKYYYQIKAYIDRAHENCSWQQFFEMSNTLAETLVSQRPISKLIAKHLKGEYTRERLEKESKNILGIEICKDQISEELSTELIQFLTNKFDQKSGALIIYKLTDEIDYLYRLFEPNFSVQNEGSEPISIPEPAYQQEANRIYENFWSAPTLLRVKLMDELLLPAHDDNPERYKKAYELVFNQVFGNEDKYVDEIKIFLDAFVNHVLPDYQKSLFLSSLMAIQNRLEHQDEKLPIGAKLAMALEMMGPAYTKFGQALHSFPDTPDDIRLGMKRLKGMASPPPRWVLWDRFDKVVPKAYRKSVKRMRKLKGSASYFTTVGLDHHDGDKTAMALERRNAGARAKHGFEQLEELTEHLHSKGLIDNDLKDAMQEIIKQAKGKIKIETNSKDGFKQSQIAAELYNGHKVRVGDKIFNFKTAQWKKYGKRFRDQEEMPGDTFNKLTKKDSGADPQYIKDSAKAYITMEFRNILRAGLFDDDRHGDQLTIKGYDFGLFDHGALDYDLPTEKDKKDLAQLLVNSFSKGDFDKSIARKLYAELNKMKRANNGEISPYLVKVARALLNMNDFLEQLSSDDLEDILIAVVNSGEIDEVIATEIFNQFSDSAASKSQFVTNIKEKMAKPSEVELILAA